MTSDSVLDYPPKEWLKLKKKSHVYQNCLVCDKRIIFTLCTDPPKQGYCPEHCPKHKWQSDYDWQTECGRCGITYVAYLQSLLEKNSIDFDIP